MKKIIQATAWNDQALYWNGESFKRDLSGAKQECDNREWEKAVNYARHQPGYELISSLSINNGQEDVHRKVNNRYEYA